MSQTTITSPSTAAATPMSSFVKDPKAIGNKHSGAGSFSLGVLACSATFAYFAYVNGNMVAGTWLSVITLVLAGLLRLSYIRASRKTRIQELTRETNYFMWRAWLDERYGLQLSAGQNDELVNAQAGVARQRRALVWGETTIMWRGLPTVVRLVGDPERELGLFEVLNNGRQLRVLSR